MQLEGAETHELTDDARVNVLYVDAAARSGSTILARIIGAQPNCMTVGEAVLIWRFGVVGNDKCSCGRNFSACTFWRDVADVAPGLFDPKTGRRYAEFLNTAVLKSRRLPWLWTAAGRERIVRAIPSGLLDDFSRLYHALRTVSGAQLVVDSSKFAVYRFLLGLVPDLNLTSVHLIRDPRAVAFSWQRQNSIVDKDHPDESLRFPRRGVLVAGLDWALQNYSTDVVNGLDDDSHPRLRYEEFVASPQLTIRELVRTTGVLGEGCDDQEEPIMQLPGVHIFGNPGRFRVGSVPIQLDDEWRRQMPSRSRRLVTVVSSPLMARYGYEMRLREPNRS